MRYLFCCLASYGYIYPALGIALKLRTQGHQVAFVTGSKFHYILTALEIPCITYPPLDQIAFNVKDWFLPESVVKQIQYTREGIQCFAPNAIIGHQLALGPLLAAEFCRLPILVLGFATYLWPLAQPLASRSSQSISLSQWRYDNAIERYNTFRRWLKLPITSVQPWDSPLLGNIFCVQSVPELEGRTTVLPERVQLIGSCLWEPTQKDPNLEAWLDKEPEKYLIYVQLGRSFEDGNIWSVLVDLLKDAPVRVVAAIGRMDDAAEFIPPNFFVREHIHQGSILSKARLVISNGHSTSVLGAITHGLPSLLFPCGSGTEDIAERCINAGVAHLLPMDVTNTQIQAMLDHILVDEGLRLRSENVKLAFQQIDGCQTAADLITTLT